LVNTAEITAKDDKEVRESIQKLAMKKRKKYSTLISKKKACREREGKRNQFLLQRTGRKDKIRRVW